MAVAAPPAATPRAPSQGAPRGSFFRLNALDASYAREMIFPMTLGLIVLVLVLAGNYVYWAINSIVNQGMSVTPILRLFLLSLPGFAVQGIPSGVILAVCLVLNRAVRDNEIIALRVGGASLPRIMAPFLFMALLASIVNFLVVEKIAPKTNERANRLRAKIVGENAAPFIDSDRYFRAGNYHFYVGTAENGVLRNVLVYERNSSRLASFAPNVFPTVYVAQKAHENPKKKGEWILEEVVVHLYNEKGSQLSQTFFGSVKIPIEQEISTYFGEQKDAFSMTLAEIDQKVKDLKTSAVDMGQIKALEVDYWRRFALPGACFVMALCAAPLSLKYARHGSFAGLVAAFMIAFLWQGFDGWLRALGIAGYLTPLVAAWGTNVLFILVGLVLMVRER